MEAELKLSVKRHWCARYLFSGLQFSDDGTSRNPSDGVGNPVWCRPSLGVVGLIVHPFDEFGSSRLRYTVPDITVSACLRVAFFNLNL
jgi:hypothetical protein